MNSSLQIKHIIGIVAIVMVLFIIIAYVVTTREDTTPETALNDPISGEVYTDDFPSGDGSSDNRVIVEGYRTLTGRGMSMLQANQLVDDVNNYLNKAGLNHNTVARIEAKSFQRSVSNKGIRTAFNLYVNDSTYIEVVAQNRFDELDTISSTFRSSDGVIVYERKS